MDEEKTAYALFAGGLIGALGVTYAARVALQSRRTPLRTVLTVTLPRERVEVFLGEYRDLRSIERLAVVDAPGGRGTEIYATSRRAKHTSELKAALRRIKSLLETGEVATNRMVAS